MSITYTVHDTGTILDGMTFARGKIIDNHPQAGECVHFGEYHIGGKYQNILVRTAGKPDLMRLVEDHRAKEAAEDDADFQRRYGKFIEEARRTGERVVVDSWVTDRCMNRNSSECSFDTATLYMSPAGKLKTEYRCCH